MSTDPLGWDGGLDPALAAQGGLDAAEAAPLEWFRFPSERHRRVATYFASGWEVAVRAANQAAKTTTGAAIVDSCLQRQPSLDGVALPLMERQVVGGLLVPSYKQASESAIPAVLKLLGTWPHKVERGAQDSVQAVRVKQRDNTDDDWRTWSRLLVLPTGGELPAGMRLDFAWADEPPDWRFWDELRGRGRANRPFPRLITFTPLDRREWEPIRHDFKGHEEPGKNRKVEVHLRLSDNSFLSDLHRRQLQEQWAGTEYAEARLNGDYVDLTGACPFPSAALNKWAARCVPPARVERFNLGDGIHADVEVWNDWQEGEACFVVCDPSSGARDEKGLAGEYDPCEALVVSRTLPHRVMARYNGYLAAYKLGALGAALGHRYGRALLVWERNGGYGEAFWLGTRDDKTGRHYPNPYREHHADVLARPLSQRLGWQTNATTRGVLVGALQQALAEDSLLVPSLAAVESLRDVRMDAMGRLEAAPGRHDEDLICLGLACHLLETLPLRTQPKVTTVGERVNAALSRGRTRGVDETDGLLW